MPAHWVALKRCAACERWRGERTVGQQPDTVDVASETVVGLCDGGPWDGSERRARSACGRWVRWSALLAGRPDPAAPPSAPPGSAGSPG